MARATFHGERQRLNNLIKQCVEFDPFHELAPHMAQYLCVRACGFIEFGIKLALTDYARGKSNDECASFIEAQIERHLPHPKPGILCDFVGGFDAKKRIDLEKFIANNEEAGSALGSLVANRHLIAHGRSSDVTVTRVKVWFESAVVIVDKLRTLFPPR
jgi:hypothetical protein